MSVQLQLMACMLCYTIKKFASLETPKFDREICLQVLPGCHCVTELHLFRKVFDQVNATITWV